MGEIYGIGTTHVPYLMSAPENMLRVRGMLRRIAEKLSGKRFVDPPEAVAEMGDDPEAVAREHHRLLWQAFGRLRAYVDEVRRAHSAREGARHGIEWHGIRRRGA